MGMNGDFSFYFTGGLWWNQMDVIWEINHATLFEELQYLHLILSNKV